MAKELGFIWPPSIFVRATSHAFFWEDLRWDSSHLKVKWPLNSGKISNLRSSIAKPSFQQKDSWEGHIKDVLIDTIPKNELQFWTAVICEHLYMQVKQKQTVAFYCLCHRMQQMFMCLYLLRQRKGSIGPTLSSWQRQALWDRATHFWSESWVLIVLRDCLGATSQSLERWQSALLVQQLRPNRASMRKQPCWNPSWPANRGTDTAALVNLLQKAKTEDEAADSGRFSSTAATATSRMMLCWHWHSKL